MNRLFLKIFLSFWLIMVVIIAASAWLNARVLEQQAPLPDPVRERLERRFERHVERLERGLPPPPWAGRGPGLIHVIDAAGRDSNPRPLPPNRRFLAARDAPEERQIGPDYIAQTVRTPDGRALRVVALARIPPRLLATGRSGAQLRLAVALLVSLAACWLLAWRLTRPLQRLRWTASRLAAGDLSRRVSPEGRYRRDEIGALGRDFDRMATGLEAAVASQQRLLRDVSHELRSPLARLQVALELARDAPAGEVGRQLDRIAVEAERLDGLIGDVLELSRQEAAARTARRETVALEGLVEQVAADARFEGQQRGVCVTVRGARDVRVRGDPVLLARALDNVVRNALAHAPDGSDVELRLAARPGQVLLAVADRGPGVPPEHLTRIFEPFHRVDEARTAGGHGIGLAIARAAVQVHGGAISARNREGGGLVVELALPPA